MEPMGDRSRVYVSAAASFWSPQGQVFVMSFVVVVSSSRGTGKQPAERAIKGCGAQMGFVGGDGANLGDIYIEREQVSDSVVVCVLVLVLVLAPLVQSRPTLART